jgi:hypothetical protein
VFARVRPGAREVVTDCIRCVETRRLFAVAGPPLRLPSVIGDEEAPCDVQLSARARRAATAGPS